MHKCLEEITQGVDRVRMVSIESNNDISRRAREPALVCSTVPAVQFRNHLGTHIASNRCRAISGSIVDNNNFVHKRRHFPENFSDAGLLVETGYDYSDAAVL